MVFRLLSVIIQYFLSYQKFLQHQNFYYKNGLNGLKIIRISKKNLNAFQKVLNLAFLNRYFIK